MSKKPKRKAAPTKIDLGQDASVELLRYHWGTTEWWFCREGKPIRAMNMDMLEGELLKMLLTQMQK